MVLPFGSPVTQSQNSLKVLFVGVNEEDTSFLTKGTSVDVVRRSSSSTENLHLEREHFDALVLDVANSRAENIQSLKKAGDTAVFMLANSNEVPTAIQMVREGADGFLVRGITNPNSFLRLATLAKGRN